MASFLFVVPPFVGHTVATISIGHELVTRGHKVTWLALGNTLKELIPTGSTWISIEENSSYRKKIKDLIKYSNQNKSTSLEKGLKSLYEKSLIPMSKLIVHDTEEAIKSIQPDLVIIDNCSFAGAIASYRTKTPYVSIITTPLQKEEAKDKSPLLKWLTQQQIQLQEKFDIYEEREIIYSTQLNLVTCPNNFLTPSDLKHPYHFVGPMLKHRTSSQQFNFNVLQKDQRPNIFISLGTLLEHRQLNFFEKIIEAFKEEDYTIIVVGQKEIIPKWPSNFIVRKSVPQLEILPYMDLVITHGGANTCCEALYFGIPLIVTPMAYDQFYMASKVVEAGCGIRLKSRRTKSEDLSHSVKEILSKKSYKIAAHKIKDLFKKTGGTENAVSLLERCLIK